MDQTLISVIIPCYNYAALLPRAVKSVFSQQAGDVEVLVVNDGSTDNTEAVTQDLQQQYPELRAIHQENAGAAAARNRGIEESTGKFLVFLDADDELEPGALAAVCQRHLDVPGAQVLIGGHWSTNPDGREKLHPVSPVAADGLQRFSDYLNKRLALSNGAVFFHRALFDRLRYPEDCRNSEDIPVFAQAVALYECAAVDAPLARIHKHDDSLRHNMAYADEVALRVVDHLFDPRLLPAPFLSLRRSYQAQRCLSLFRSYYLAKDWAKAKKYYRLAVSTDRRSLLKWSYLSKFLRLMLRERHE
ncbi:glycosyltransferase family 2 protein [Aestuariirhabdus litorea]|uniref:Glycosyltransferase family 2 protein n=1 Tax=Aestuariirhabdus litorea TaxID=2528527 RepID=A0A3P3VI04_9GAMM|nr:glycosyltransferase family 2 protein [Aestuariirhabdus litorea]RRJ82355.1 glycosyltransferase family 2 protein [Aestuariirhabdus litorea]RWW92519.1 glycosyltransferase [Endozoicomonadaceae bacterium GTF-13]